VTTHAACIATRSYKGQPRNMKWPSKSFVWWREITYKIPWLYPAKVRPRGAGSNYRVSYKFGRVGRSARKTGPSLHKGLNTIDYTDVSNAQEQRIDIRGQYRYSNLPTRKYEYANNSEDKYQRDSSSIHICAVPCRPI